MIESELLKKLCGYIGGQWCAADSGKKMPVINPATGEKIADVPVMGCAETTRAIEAASAALERPLSIEQRSQWLNRIADAIVENQKELGRIITHEHGKPWKEAIGEAAYAASFFRYYAGQVEHLQPKQLQEKPRDHRWTVHYRPAGVVALVTPWNFPLAMLAKKLSAALAAGCASVIKPSSKTPLSMISLFSLIDQLGLPPGLVNLVLGPAGEISGVLCEHRAVRVISFTGSTGVGKKLMAACAPHLKRLSLELGGNAPFIVFDDADVDSAITALMPNKFRGAGQTCVCANRVYVQQGALQSFSEKLAQRVGAMKVGNGMEEATEIGPLIDASAQEKVREIVADALRNGAVKLAEATVPANSHPQASFFPPVVLGGVTRNMVCVSEETFGPVVPLISFATEDEVIQAANDTEYGLAAYLFTNDPQRAERVIARLAFGHVGLNTGTGPTAEAPFGGMKQSGFGREGGFEGLHDFIEPQTVPCPQG